MEKVKVVIGIPGILNEGDTLVSPVAGEDFVLQETNEFDNGTTERFVSLDYVTVSENIPNYFIFDTDEDGNLVDTDDLDSYEEVLEQMITPMNGVQRTEEEIEARYRYFQKEYEKAFPTSEAQVVFRNLMWFIEWLQGKQELVNVL